MRPLTAYEIRMNELKKSGWIPTALTDAELAKVTAKNPMYGRIAPKNLTHSE